MNHKTARAQLRSNTRSRRKIQSYTSLEHTLGALQDYFLASGVQTIMVPSVEQGRSLLRVGLDSLGLYSNIGMLTASVRRAPYCYADIYSELRALSQGNFESEVFEEYLLQSFNCDFLIVEYSQELMNQPWFGPFEALLHEYALASSLPVLLLFYEQDAITAN